MSPILASPGIPDFSSTYDHYAPALFGIILKVEPDSGKASLLLLDLFVDLSATSGIPRPGNQSYFTWMILRCARLLRKKFPLKAGEITKIIFGFGKMNARSGVAAGV